MYSSAEKLTSCRNGTNDTGSGRGYHSGYPPSNRTPNRALCARFDVYARALHEFFRRHEMTDYEWLTAGASNGGSKIYQILDYYQQEGYHELVGIADQYHGAFLCDGVGLGKTFIGLMLIESLIKQQRKRVALFVPKAARKPVWESKLRQYLPELFGEYSNLAIYNHTDLLRGGDYPDRLSRSKNWPTSSSSTRPTTSATPGSRAMIPASPSRITGRCRTCAKAKRSTS